jgi:hypothetical protein
MFTACPELFFLPLSFTFSILSPMSAASSSDIISQKEFDIYSNDWLNVVTNDDADELAKCFRLEGADKNINCVFFSAMQIAHLVSTVGAQHIKARFLVIREDNGHPHFALALFAGDDLNGRLSAYYISRPYWLRSANDPQSSGPGDAGPGLNVFSPVRLPDALAALWLNNWSPKGPDPRASQDMFNSTYGYLRGYTFEMDDFLNPFTQIKAGVKIEHADPFRINFGLHQYYPINSEELDSTFGLMVSYVDYAKRAQILKAKSGMAPGTPPADNDSNDDDDTGVFYDLATPCPPKC